jgi:hypothetical protein
MEWTQFTEKYSSYGKEYNEQPFEERVRVSRLMAYEAIRELIRSKKHLHDAISKIDERIKTLSQELDKTN